MNFDRIQPILVGMALLIAVTPAAASAADWWLLSRPPAGETALFADADSLAVEPGGGISMRVLRIDRNGRSTESVERVVCRRSDRLSRFACATPEDRDNHGLILGGMDPSEAARMLFDMAPTEAERRGDGPDR